MRCRIVGLVRDSRYDMASRTSLKMRSSRSGAQSWRPRAPGNGMTWDNAPEFASGAMPTQLGGVSVTVNGKAAFVSYISATQVNVLTPLDSTTGPVQIVVTSGGAARMLTGLM